MSERYLRKYSLPTNLYAPGCPVIIKAGALLLDQQIDKTLAQLKFMNISSKTIVALAVQIIAYDAFFKQIGDDVVFSYIDLSAKRNEIFGSEIPVWLPDPFVRSFSVSISKIVFSDSSVWVAPENNLWTSLPVQQEINKALGDKLTPQFIRNTTKLAEFVPDEADGLWICTCGAINSSEEAICHICDVSLIRQKECLDLDQLNKQLNDYEDVEKENQLAIKKTKIKKTSKLLVIFVSTAIIVCVLLFSVIIPLWRQEKQERQETLITGLKSYATRQSIKKVELIFAYGVHDEITVQFDPAIIDGTTITINGYVKTTINSTSTTTAKYLTYSYIPFSVTNGGERNDFTMWFGDNRLEYIPK